MPAQPSSSHTPTHPTQVAYNNARLQPPQDCVPALAEIITACLNDDPTQRPDFATLTARLEEAEQTEHLKH